MFTYQSLNDPKREIRLLQFEVGQNGVIRGNLQVAALRDEPQFSALSYVWGDPGLTSTLFVDGQPIQVTINLDNALRKVPQHWKENFPDRSMDSFLIWADALCINQDDAAEKNYQVMMMSEIYSSAECVFSWLGDDDGFLHLAFDTYQIVSDEVDQQPSLDDFFSLQWMTQYPFLYADGWGADDDQVEFKNAHWHATITLGRLEYWSRVWILQETGFAKKLIICCGSRAINWEMIRTTCNALKNISRGIKRGSPSCPDFLEGTTIWEFLACDFTHMYETEYTIRAREVADAIKRQSRDPRHRAEGFFMSLNGAGLKASNPKDHVYGLLSLSRLDIIPDYSKEKSVGDVYRDYVAALLKAVSTGNLGEWTPVDSLFFLSWAGLGLFENKLGLPSWAPNFPEDAEKARPVPILKDLERSTPAYRRIFSEEAESASVTGSNLNVTCWFVDTIAQVHIKPSVKTLSDGSLLKFFQTIVSRADSQSASDPPPLQKMVQTMRLNPTLLVDEDHAMWAFALLILLMRPCADVESINNHLLALGLQPLEDESFGPSFIQAFAPGYKGKGLAWRDEFLWHRARPDIDEKLTTYLNVHSASQRWKFYETATGQIGFGPLHFKPGDLICILYGSAFPVILRKQGALYVHVGVCFQVGLRPEEVTDGVPTGGRDIQRIQIV